MAAPRQSERSFKWPQVSAFRLRRHHFLDQGQVEIAALCGDLCGVQAQVMGSAQTALWTRAHHISREQTQSALWKQRSLVKTSLMRQTLHLIPAADFPLYITALKSSRVNALLRIMAPFGIKRKEVDAMNALVLDLLGDKPVPQREVAEKVRPRLSKGLRRFMELFFSVVRPAVVEGLVCHGPDLGREATVVRVDRWLPRQKTMEERQAKEIVLCRYLRAYGPASLQDFCKWSGISVKEGKIIWESCAGEMVEVAVEGLKKMILREDLTELESSELEGPLVRLLPGFDPYLLAHAEKSHLVSAQHYKRVYRNQGWISPVVLVNGRVTGIWSSRRQGRTCSVEVELFEKISRMTRDMMNEEIESFSQFAKGAAALDSMEKSEES